LRIWNSVNFPNNVIGTKGNLYIDGYNLLDFNNNNVKSKYIYELKTHAIDVHIVKKIIVTGNNNKIHIHQSFNNDVIIKNNGKNELHIKKVQIHIRSLTITNIDGMIDFDSNICNNLLLEIKGTGFILDLGTSLTARVKIVGSSVIALNKLRDTFCDEEIYGTGKVIWNNID